MAQQNDDYPGDEPVLDPAHLSPGYADECQLNRRATVFRRSPSEPYTFRELPTGQQILEPTGNTEMLVAGRNYHGYEKNETNNNFYRSDGNERVLRNKAYRFVLDRKKQEPEEILSCNFGSVVRAELILNNNERWETCGVPVAIKRLDWKKVVDAFISGRQNNPFQEVAVMQYLQRFCLQTHQGPPLPEEEIAGPAMNAIQRSQRSTLDSHVLMPLDVFKDDNFLYIIMPYLDGGDLYDRVTGNRMTEDEARHFLSQAIQGMEFLQRAGISHRDLSIENLLTYNNASNDTVVFDFGMSLKIPYLSRKNHIDDHRTEQRCLINGQGHCGKDPYMAPEVYRCQLTNRRNYEPFDGHAIDVWALGPIMFAILSGGLVPWKSPHLRVNANFTAFTNGSQRHLVTWVRNVWRTHYERLGSMGFNENSWFALWFERNVETGQLQSTACFSLFQDICRYNPRDRLSLRQVKNHAWMNPVPAPPPSNDLQSPLEYDPKQMKCCSIC